MPSFKLLCLACSLCGAACGAGTGCFLADRPATEFPTPADDRDALIAQALGRAVIEEKDIPDYALLQDASRIVVSNTTNPFQEGGATVTFTADALPESGEVEFILLSPEEIQRRADEQGDFAYLFVGNVEVDGAAATIEVGTTWARSKDSTVFYLSGGGYRLRYQKQDGRWVFQEIVTSWISRADPEPGTQRAA